MTQNDTHQQDHAAPQAEQSVQGAVRRSGPDPAKTYDGKPCKNCGATLRWKSNNGCIACKRAREREKRRINPEYAERRRNELRGYRTDPEYREHERESQRVRDREYRTDPEWRERRRQWHRDRYDNDTLFRHGLLLKKQIQRSARRLKEAEQRG